MFDYHSFSRAPWWMTTNARLTSMLLSYVSPLPKETFTPSSIAGKPPPPLLVVARVN